MDIIQKGVSPITKEIAKEHLRTFSDSDHDVEDVTIQLYIDAAYTFAENYTWRKLSTTKVREYFSSWQEEFKTQYEIQSEDSFTVKYKNSAGVLTVNNDFAFDEKCKTVYAKDFGVLPELSELRNPVYLEYDTGFEEVPKDIVLAMLLLITDYYDERIDTLTQIFNVNGLYSKSSEVLLNNYKLKSFA